MIKFLIKIIILICVGLAWWFFGTLVGGNDLEAKTFVVKRGQGLNEVSQNLHNSELIKNKFVFETWAWVKGIESKIVAGVYEIPEDVAIPQLLNILTLGSASDQSALTIVEGWDRGSDKLEETLTEHGLNYQEFLQLTASKTDWQADYDFLRDGSSTASLEGYLFPNTHFVNQDTTVRSLIIKLLNDFDKKLSPELRQEIAKQNKTIFEVITLASIVEREVPNDDDKKMIADIFLKRLDNNIGLQSDATINFITGKGTVQPTYEDTQVKSPYNTYIHRGLPPGPIASPGLAAIEAVIYPTSNPYYFFLTTLDTGEVIYSTTYDEHLDNKARYLK